MHRETCEGKSHLAAQVASWTQLRSRHFNMQGLDLNKKKGKNLTKHQHICAFLPVTSAGRFLFAPVLEGGMPRCPF